MCWRAFYDISQAKYQPGMLWCVACQHTATSRALTNVYIKPKANNNNGGTRLKGKVNRKRVKKTKTKTHQ